VAIDIETGEFEVDEISCLQPIDCSSAIPMLNLGSSGSDLAPLITAELKLLQTLGELGVAVLVFDLADGEGDRFFGTDDNG
jgi:hypothetical protein